MPAPFSNSVDPKIVVAGLMTGTSCDGLDIACVEFSWLHPERQRLLWSVALPYPKALKLLVLKMQKPGFKATTQDWLSLDRDLSFFYASRLNEVFQKQSPRPDVIANHGQTVAHFAFQKKGGLTWQLGDPAVIATLTGITTVGNFRRGDLAAHGQGAPLAPRYHHLLVDSGVAYINLGGIANFTHGEIACDTGPGNIWIDAAVDKITSGKKKWDDQGKIGRSGFEKRDMRAIAAFLKDPYLKLSPPKSTGRDQFSVERFFRLTKARGPALVATATEMSALSIARGLGKWVVQKGIPLRKIIVGGGGANNIFLLERIHEVLSKEFFASGGAPAIEPLSADEAQSIEARAFAYFGVLCLKGQPLGGPWTGATQWGSPGVIAPGTNWSQLQTILSISEHSNR